MSQPEGPVLFVSHHSSQLEVAEHVERALNAKGVRCWIAPRDVEPGASFARAIPDAIGESSAVLLLFSAASVKSPHVERELILADQLGKTIIPLRIEKIVDPGGLRYHLAAAQWIDWLEQRDAAIDRIAARAHGFDQDGTRSEPRQSGPSEGGASAGAYAPPPPPPPSPPMPPSAGPLPYGAAPLPHYEPAPPPHSASGDYGYGHPMPRGDGSGGGGGGGGAKWLWISLGGAALAGLIALIIWLAAAEPSEQDQQELQNLIEQFNTSTGDTGGTVPDTPARDDDTDPVTEAGAITESSFAGVWSDTRDCAEPYRFDPGGVLTAPTGAQGSWEILNGKTLVVTANGEEIRRQLTRVSDDEIIAEGEPIYRCLS